MSDILKSLYTETLNFMKSISKYLRLMFVILMFLLSSLFELIPIYLFDIDIDNDSITPITNIYLTIFANACLLAILAFTYRRKIKSDFIALKKTDKRNWIVIMDNVLRYWFIGLIIMVASNFLIGKLGISTSVNDDNIRSFITVSPLLASISVIILSPFIEEIVFRLAFREVFNKKWFFILISGIFFGSLHVIISFTSYDQLLYLIPYCSLGIAFSYIYYYSDNVFISYSVHLLHNAIAAMITFLMAGVIIW